MARRTVDPDAHLQGPYKALRQALRAAGAKLCPGCNNFVFLASGTLDKPCVTATTHVCRGKGHENFPAVKPAMEAA